MAQRRRKRPRPGEEKGRTNESISEDVVDGNTPVPASRARAFSYISHPRQTGVDIHSILDVRLRPLTEPEKNTFSRLCGKTENYTGTKRLYDGHKLETRAFLELLPGAWIRDLIVNAFVELVNERNAKFFENLEGNVLGTESGGGSHIDWYKTGLFDRPRPRTFVFSSFAYSRLISDLKSPCSKNTGDPVPKYNYSMIEKWMKRGAKKDIQDVDLVLFPVNIKDSHWYVGGVDIRSKEFFCVDCLGIPRPQFVENVARWYKDEVYNQHGKEIDVSQWGKVACVDYAPKQTDGSSCGVFMLFMIDCLELGQLPDFIQSDMDLLRQKIGLFLDDGKLPESLER